MIQRVKMFAADVLAAIKKEILQFWLMVSNFEYRLIKRSGIFDPDYYLSENPDLVGSRENLLVHYIRKGEDELRSVSVFFDRDYYLSQLASPEKDFTNPLVHFLEKGWRQGKKPNPLFHTDYYLNCYPDVSNSRMDPLSYYLKRGWRQEHCTSPEMMYLAEDLSITALVKDKINPLAYFLKREPYPCFDSVRYLDQVPELEKFTDDYWGHYMKYGAANGKSPIFLFDPSFYRQNNSGIHVDCLDVYTHYQSGKRYERLRPSKWFDPAFYMEQVTEDEMSGLTPLEHYLEKGVYERRYTDKRVFNLREKPVISVIVPVYNVNPHYLNNCIRSVLYQTYPYWELCLADDRSTDSHVRPLLRGWEKRDERIKVVYLGKNCGISEATTNAAELTSGKYLAFLDNDDELTLDALYHVVEAMQRTGAEVVYSDEDLIGDDGTVFSTFYKPDYNAELLLCHNYITHLLVVSANLFEKSGGFLKERDGAQDYDLILKLAALAHKVDHIPRVLYHWRASETSTSINHQQKHHADRAGRCAVENALQRMGREGEVLQTDWKFYYQVKFNRNTTPFVSIILVWQDNICKGVGWLESLCRLTTYSAFEILVVLSESEELQVEKVAEMRGVDSRVRVIFLPESYSQAAFYNSAVNHAAGEYLAFVSSDIQVSCSGWLEALLQFAQFDDTGFVGGHIKAAKNVGFLLSTVPDVTNESSEYYLQWLSGSSQHMNGLQCSQEILSVTGELCLARKSHFEKCSGLDMEAYPYLYAFADLSLKYREYGLRNIYAATCLAQRTRSSVHTRKNYADDKKIILEQGVFQDRWRSVLQAGDPFYNPGCYREKGISDEQFYHWYLGVYNPELYLRYHS